MKTTVVIDRIEDVLELEVSYEESPANSSWFYTVESAKLNGDEIAPGRVLLTSSEETQLRLRCVEAAL